MKFRSINFHYQSPASQISPFCSEKIKLPCIAAILDANMHIESAFPMKVALKYNNNNNNNNNYYYYYYYLFTYLLTHILTDLHTYLHTYLLTYLLTATE